MLVSLITPMLVTATNKRTTPMLATVITHMLVTADIKNNTNVDYCNQQE